MRELKSGERDKIELQSLKAEGICTRALLIIKLICKLEGKDLVVALTGNHQLTNLSITSSPSLGDRFMRSLSTWLATSPSLTHLTLFHASLTSAAAVVLSDAMHTNAHITHLDLRGNTISDPGAVSLAEAMIVSSHLAVLLLDNNTIGEPVSIRLCFSFDTYHTS
jgi:hypothetical protein